MGTYYLALSYFPLEKCFAMVCPLVFRKTLVCLSYETTCGETYLAGCFVCLALTLIGVTGQETVGR